MDYSVKTCEECGLRYHPERDIAFHHHHLCSHRCLEDFKEDHPELKDHNGHDLQLSLDFGETKH